MKAYEIFQEIAPETSASVFQFLRDEQREAYTAALCTLAANRKLRPVFIQRKPAPAQIEWLAKNVKLKGSAEIAEQVIQLWLMKSHQKLLVEFLDGVGIQHDGEGAAEDIPDEIDKKKLKATVSKMLGKHDPELVRIYLHVFQMQSPDGWTEISELIEATPELQFGNDAVAAAPEPELAAEPATEETASGEESDDLPEEAEKSTESTEK